MEKTEIVRRINTIRKKHKTSLRGFGSKKEWGHDTISESLLRLMKERYLLDIEVALLNESDEISDIDIIFPKSSHIQPNNKYLEDYIQFENEVKYILRTGVEK